MPVKNYIAFLTLTLFCLKIPPVLGMIIIMFPEHFRMTALIFPSQTIQINSSCFTLKKNTKYKILGISPVVSVYCYDATITRTNEDV